MDYTADDVKWAREVLASPERTAAIVEAFHANPDDLDVGDSILFLHEVLNGRAT